MKKSIYVSAMLILLAAAARAQEPEPFVQALPPGGIIPGDEGVLVKNIRHLNDAKGLLKAKIGGSSKEDKVFFSAKVGPGDRDLFNDLFQPDQIMRSQKALALSDEQRSAIKTEVHEAEATFFDLQWEQRGEEENLKELLKQPQPDEQKSMDQLEKLLTIENTIKKVRLKHLIKVKSLLTTEQQTKLRELVKTEGPIFDRVTAGFGGSMSPETGTVFYRSGPSAPAMPPGAPARLMPQDQ